MNTIVKPLITEKTLTLAGRGWYTFASVLHARKEQIARDIHDMYKVTVTDVRTVSMHGKVRRAGKRSNVARPDWKKALVHLAPGQHIDAFEVTSQQDMEKAAEALVEKPAEKSADAKAPEGKEKKGKK